MKGFGPISSSSSQCLFPAAADLWGKRGKDKGPSKKQKKGLVILPVPLCGHQCEADFVPVAEAEAENIKCQKEVYPHKLSRLILHNKEIWLVQIRAR